MPGSPRNSDLLHLVRLDAKGTAGWQLRLPPWHPLGESSQYFSDASYGGPQKAYRAAREKRDRLFKDAGLPLRRKGHQVHQTNRSFLVGVSLAFDPRRKGESAFRWAALWSEDGKSYKKSFGVASLGFTAALMAAIELREARTGLRFKPEDVLQALSLERRVKLHASR